MVEIKRIININKKKRRRSKRKRMKPFDSSFLAETSTWLRYNGSETED
jgi:hypothetical protein